MRLRFIALAVTFASSAVFGEDLQCLSLPRGELYCISVEYHPSGPSVTQSWRKRDDLVPYRLVFTSARSGKLLLENLQLLFASKENAWIIRDKQGHVNNLILGGAPLPSTIKDVHAEGYEWEILVIKENIPQSAQEVASEDEPSLDLAISRN